MLLAETIQTHFIDIIAHTLGDPPKNRDWPGDLAAFIEGQTVSSDQLQAAARRIVADGGKTFPAFRTCLGALQQISRTPATGATAATGRVTARTYSQLALEHGRFRNYPPGGYPVVSRFSVDTADAPATARQWRAWKGYFDKIGIRCTPDVMTVPELWPWDFDRSYTHAPEPEPTRQSELETLERRELMKRRFDSLIRSLPAGKTVTGPNYKTPGRKAADDADDADGLIPPESGSLKDRWSARI